MHQQLMLNATYEDADHMRFAFRALNVDTARIVLWSVVALALGPAWVSPIPDCIVDEQTVERMRSAQEAEKALEKGACSDPV